MQYALRGVGDRFQHVTVVLWCAEFMRDRTSCENTNRTSPSLMSIPKKFSREHNAYDVINIHNLNTRTRVDKCSDFLKYIFHILIRYCLDIRATSVANKSYLFHVLLYYT
jgi:hypothetical protein